MVTARTVFTLIYYSSAPSRRRHDPWGVARLERHDVGSESATKLAHAVPLCELVGGGGAARAKRVAVRRQLRVAQVVQRGREDAPRLELLLGRDEVGVVVCNHLEQQPLVRLRQLALELPGEPRVEEVHPHLLHLVGAQAGHLALHLPVDGLLGLHAHDELVRLASAERRDGAGHSVELDAQLHLVLGDGLRRLEDEWDARPARVVDVEHCRRKRLGAGGLVAHRRLLEVAAAHLRAAVLAEHHVGGGERRDGLQHLELLGADVLGGERERLLHRDESHHLQQVVLHHVANDAVLVKVAAAPLDAALLLEDDLHRLDSVPVPQRTKADVCLCSQGA
mmetsp:Transcript_30456/g.101858  ORF Transcript_30456/g.101858 Transcript_30456/m.101858 type:complete len:336 (+) Transcript_30456:58-1065(+)